MLRDSGMTWKAVGKAEEIDYRTCQGIYRRSRANGIPTNRRRQGRLLILNQGEKARLREFVTRDKNTRRLSWESIVQEMRYLFSPRTIKGVIASMGYHKRLPRKKQVYYSQYYPNYCITNVSRWEIRLQNLLQRVRWFQDRLHWIYEECFRTVWSDKSTFNTAGFGHRHWVIRTSQVEYHADCIDETWKSGRKNVMVWGAFCGEMKTELVFTLPGVTINSRVYVYQILQLYLIPFCHDTREEYGWTQLVEDNALGHKGRENICRQINEMDVIPWPSQSPDFNLIEALQGR